MPLLSESPKSEKDRQLFNDWVKVRAYVNEYLGRRPDLNGILYLIGMTELGIVKTFSKEEKEDLMHIGMCRIFQDVLYTFTHRDEEGWLHFEPIGDIERLHIRDQEALIKEHVVKWFKENEII